MCRYDRCSEDTDCPLGQVCDCSTCTEPTCATDQDCATDEQLKGTTVTAHAFHPGAIRSGLYRGLTGPSRWALLAVQPLLRRESAVAHRAAFDPDLDQASGALLVDRQYLTLDFETDYRQRLGGIAQEFLRRSLAHGGA